MGYNNIICYRVQPKTGTTLSYMVTDNKNANYFHAFNCLSMKNIMNSHILKIIIRNVLQLAEFGSLWPKSAAHLAPAFARVFPNFDVESI